MNFELILVFLLGAVSVGCGAALFVRLRSRPEGEMLPLNRVDWILAALSFPVAAVGLFLATRRQSKEEVVDPVVDVPEQIDTESESERVHRVVEEIASKEGDRIREVASDDEVASRGADLFDPGRDA